MEQVNDIVFPGDVIAKEEEYLSGRNTQDIDGNIIATAFGKVSRDDKSLVISVDTQKQAVVIRRYDIVYGKIIKILNKEAVILVSGVDKGKAIVTVATEARLKLPIPNKTMYSHIVTLGDILRAKIVSTRPLYATIFESGLGVLKGRCTVCRSELIADNGKLYCKNCGRIEQRKIAPDYGNINISGVNYERSR
ncbi:exosome complex RNA-binding protein Csl4 [Ferroplasma acidiphilum]|uniref:exosome complex RNA-binding protein Csl4 n=1 Tax=Ferroplasma acidiphilum TaxID=74969 RepID=UPI0023EF58DB|nr:exosome complex RNA-binding protein Csl4 [Ferroplasma acidiphilum]WMT53044.1 MAG: exosome complex RNA-binding protein Csl4 [Ferroplasma acidiphilum]